MKAAFEMKGYIPVWPGRLVDVMNRFLDRDQTYEGTFERGWINALYASFISRIAELTTARIYVIGELDTKSYPYRSFEVYLTVLPNGTQVNVMVGEWNSLITLEEHRLSDVLIQSSLGDREFTKEDYFNSVRDEDAFEELSRKLWEILDEKFYGIFIKRDHYVW
jgi:hypothetical protein